MKKYNKLLFGMILFTICFIGMDNVKAEIFRVQFKCGESPGFGIAPPTSGACSFNIVEKQMTSFSSSCYIESKNSGNSSKTQVVVDRSDVEITEESKCYTMSYNCTLEKKSKNSKTYIYKLKDFKLTANSSTNSDPANAIICPSEPLIDLKGCRDLTNTNYKVKCPGLSSKKFADVKTICENTDSISWERTCKSKGASDKDIDDLIRSIKEKASESTGQDANPDYGLAEQTNCKKLLGDGENSLATVLKNVFFVIGVVGVVILVVTMASDFIKAIASSDDDAVAKAFKSAKTRIIATIILLLLPVIVSFIIDVVNDNVHEEDGTIKIGNISECQIIDG